MTISRPILHPVGHPFASIFGTGKIGDKVTRAFIDLLLAANTSTTGATVLALPVDGVVADGNSLITIPPLFPRITEGRWVDTVAGGAALGVDLAVNGGFDTDTDWTKAANTVIAGGLLTFSGANGATFQTGAIAVNIKYRVTYTITGYVSGNCTIRLGASASGITRSANGTFTEEIMSGAIGTTVNIIPVTFFGSVDNISWEQVIPHWSVQDADGVGLTNSLSVFDAGVNIVTAVKANPVDLTNVSKVGDAAAVLSVVDDSAELSIAGLDEVCNGNVYKLDNTGGSGNAGAYFGGAVANTNKHSMSCQMRVDSGSGHISWWSNFAAVSASVSSGDYVNIEAENLTPPSSTEQMMITAPAGAIVYFILPQLEESAFMTPIIIGADTAASASRDADINTVSTPSVLTPQSGAIEFVVDPAMTNTSFGVILSSYVDANNNFYAYISSNKIFFRRFVGGVSQLVDPGYFDTAGTPLRFQAFWGDTSGFGIRIADASADITAVSFTVNADTTDFPVDTLLEIGNRQGASPFIGEYANNGVPITWSSAQAAGWL